MKRKELKSNIRNVDIVKIFNKSLNFYVQVNKTKLLEALDTEVSKDMTWSNIFFNLQDNDGKKTFFIN